MGFLDSNIEGALWQAEYKVKFRAPNLTGIKSATEVAFEPHRAFLQYRHIVNTAPVWDMVVIPGHNCLSFKKRASNPLAVLGCVINQCTTTPLHLSLMWKEACTVDLDLSGLRRALQGEDKTTRYRYTDLWFHYSTTLGLIVEDEGSILKVEKYKALRTRHLHTRVVPISLIWVVMSAHQSSPLSRNMGTEKTF